MSNTPDHELLNLAIRVVAGATAPTSGTPFSDYGHLGRNMIDRRCILQDEIWVDIHGNPHRLTEMSAEYRANVFELLQTECPNWMVLAYHWTINATLVGLLPPEQASREIEALGSLRSGWTMATPIARRLCQLNGITLDQRPVVRAPLTTRDDLQAPETLRDGNRGVWAITTAASRYVIDLDQRRLKRCPGHEVNDAALTEAPRLPLDGEWSHLSTLVDCARGRSLFALDIQAGEPGFRLSSRVETIRRRAVT